MRADVIPGVIIVEFVPLYGAALVILCCLWMDTGLPARNYDLIFDRYSSYNSRMLHWNNQRATTCALTRIPHDGMTYPFRALCRLYIGGCLFIHLYKYKVIEFEPVGVRLRSAQPHNNKIYYE